MSWLEIILYFMMIILEWAYPLRSTLFFPLIIHHQCIWWCGPLCWWHYALLEWLYRCYLNMGPVLYIVAVLLPIQIHIQCIFMYFQCIILTIWMCAQYYNRIAWQKTLGCVVSQWMLCRVVYMREHFVNKSPLCSHHYTNQIEQIQQLKSKWFGLV